MVFTETGFRGRVQALRLGADVYVYIYTHTHLFIWVGGSGFIERFFFWGLGCKQFSGSLRGQGVFGDLWRSRGRGFRLLEDRISRISWVAPCKNQLLA